MRKRALTACFALAAFAAACAPPKYATYTSVFGDYKVSVPWGWQVIADADGPAFTEVRFIGPFDKDFYLGAPSLSIRWYRSYRPHTLRDGSLEMYAGADDFIDQTLKQVYGPNAILYGAEQRRDANGNLTAGRELLGQGAVSEEIVPKALRRKAKFFGVLSPTPAPEANQWGVERDGSGEKLVNFREHDYVVVPMEGGFYVLCYPATRQGYPKGVDRFREMVNTFLPLTEGPGGPKARRITAAP